MDWTKDGRTDGCPPFKKSCHPSFRSRRSCSVLHRRLRIPHEHLGEKLRTGSGSGVVSCLCLCFALCTRVLSLFMNSAPA